MVDTKVGQDQKAWQKKRTNKTTGSNNTKKVGQSISLKKKNSTLSYFVKSQDNKKKATVKVGNNYTLKITALSSTNLGLNEFTFGFPVLIGGLQEAKATLGDFVQVKI